MTTMRMLKPYSPFFSTDFEGGDLFGLDAPKDDPTQKPLAERMRPTTLETFVGQQHLVGPSGALQPLLSQGRLHSMIFWGDPGIGKTTLARIVAAHVDAEFIQLSAITSGVADVRNVIKKAKLQKRGGRRTLLFIDEIHRFNKGQQDALLHAVEEGTITLVGATTENPSFEVNTPLLSRCRVYRFQPLTAEDLDKLVDHAMTGDIILKDVTVQFEPEARKALLELARGDARECLNLLERSIERAQLEERTHINVELLEGVAQQALSRYDKGGEAHYDVISAFIKTVRNSDPNAAIYWLARMLHGGEDPLFIARRLIILASEDIGNANPNALLLAQTAFDAVHKIGMPEARIVLAQATTYLASSPKSNAAYMAINEALDLVAKGKQHAVPMHLRNAPTRLMKAEGYGKDYLYSHDQPGAVSDMPGLPPELEGHQFYRPTNYGSEAQIARRLDEIEKMKASMRGQRNEEDPTT